MTRKPAPGDHITAQDSLTDEVYSGVVIDLLAMQFTYELENGIIRFAFYDSGWINDIARSNSSPSLRS